jgi:hypothetical protein
MEAMEQGGVGGLLGESLSLAMESMMQLRLVSLVFRCYHYATSFAISHTFSWLLFYSYVARADIGIAIGAGTQVAVEAADVILVRSSLHDVVVALHLSKVVFRRIKLNFLWAMSYNVCALPFAAGILYPFTSFRLPPELAGLMMAFSSVSVVTSSLLLKNYTRPLIREDGSIEGGDGLLSRLVVAVDGGHAWCSSQLSGEQRYEDVPTKLNDATAAGLELV